VKPPKWQRVNRLVLEAFVGPPPTPLHEAAHKNGKSADNYYENLVWKTKSENWQDRRLHGTDNSGERGSKAVLTLAQVREIRLIEGMSRSQIGALYGVSKGTIQAILEGRSWKSAELR
jgi:DNA-binding transcriptional regulator YiaG